MNARVMMPFQNADPLVTTGIQLVQRRRQTLVEGGQDRFFVEGGHDDRDPPRRSVDLLGAGITR